MTEYIPVINKQFFPMENVNPIGKYDRGKPADFANYRKKIRGNSNRVINTIDIEGKLQGTDDKLHEICQKQKKDITLKEDEDFKDALLPRVVNLSEVQKTNQNDLNEFIDQESQNQGYFHPRVIFEPNYQRIARDSHSVQR